MQNIVEFVGHKTREQWEIKNVFFLHDFLLVQSITSSILCASASLERMILSLLIESFLSLLLFVFSSSPSCLLFVRLLKRMRSMAIAFVMLHNQVGAMERKYKRKIFPFIKESHIFPFIPFEWLKDETKISFSINRCSNGHKPHIEKQTMPFVQTLCLFSIHSKYEMRNKQFHADTHHIFTKWVFQSGKLLGSYSSDE